MKIMRHSQSCESLTTTPMKKLTENNTNVTRKNTHFLKSTNFASRNKLSNESLNQRFSVVQFGDNLKKHQLDYERKIKLGPVHKSSYIDLGDTFKNQNLEEIDDPNNKNFNYKTTLKEYNDSLIPVEKVYGKKSKLKVNSSLNVVLNQNEKAAQSLVKSSLPTYLAGERSEPPPSIFKTLVKNISDRKIFNQAKNRDFYGKKHHTRVKSEVDKVNELFRKGINDNDMEALLPNEEKMTYPLYNRKLEVISDENKNYFNKGVLDSTKLNKIFERNFLPVARYSKNLTRDAVLSLDKEIENAYTQPIRLLEPKKFSKSYRKLNEFTDVESDKDILKFINKLTHHEDLSKWDYIKNIGNIRINKDDLTKIKTIRKNNRMKEWRDVMVSAAKHFHKLDVELTDVFEKKAKIDISVKEEDLNYLIQVIRDNNYFLARRLLTENKYLALSCDKLKQYPLHWAVKRKNYRLASLFVSYNSPIDERDLSGRTPLHICLENDSRDIMRLLLFEGASPFTKTLDGRTPIDLAKSIECREVIKRTKSLHIINATDNYNTFLLRIKHGLRFFIEQLDRKYSKNQK